MQARMRRRSSRPPSVAAAPGSRLPPLLQKGGALGMGDDGPVSCRSAGRREWLRPQPPAQGLRVRDRPRHEHRFSRNTHARTSSPAHRGARRSSTGPARGHARGSSRDEPERHPTSPIRCARPCRAGCTRPASDRAWGGQAARAGARRVVCDPPYSQCQRYPARMHARRPPGGGRHRSPGGSRPDRRGAPAGGRAAARHPRRRGPGRPNTVTRPAPVAATGCVGVQPESSRPRKAARAWPAVHGRSRVNRASSRVG